MKDGCANRYVCAECFDDEHLREQVAIHAESPECDFCGDTSDKPFAAPADPILDLIRDAILPYYRPANDVLFYDSEEDRWDGPTLDTWELLEDADLPCRHPQLIDAVVDHFGGDDVWVRESFLEPTEGESVSLDWERFVEQVKSRRRFIFAKPPWQAKERDIYQLATPSETLRRVGDLVEEYGLVRELEPSETLFRVRVHDRGTPAQTAKDLGSPPARNAQANRMSPPGISTFYGAFDDLTAVAETVDQADAAEKLVALGTFVLTSGALIVDLTRVPDVPSLYETTTNVSARLAREKREALLFLHSWIRDLGRPVKRDGAEHIDYVPTQILGEYFQFEHQHPEAMPITGVAFQSSRSTTGTVVALFIPREDCIEKADSPDASRPQLVLQAHEQLRIEFEVRIKR